MLLVAEISSSTTTGDESRNPNMTSYPSYYIPIPTSCSSFLNGFDRAINSCIPSGKRTLRNLVNQSQRKNHHHQQQLRTTVESSLASNSKQGFDCSRKTSEWDEQLNDTLFTHTKWNSLGTINMGDHQLARFAGFFSLFLKRSLGVKLSGGGLLGNRARTLESFLLLAAEVKFIRVVIHAPSIRIHLLGALLVKFFQPAIKNIIRKWSLNRMRK